MKKLYFVLTALFVFGTIALVTARSPRVSQIPNGSVYNCANCHTSAAGGGARNSFGQDVGARLTQPGAAGKVEWGPELALLDSDGDGFTNGQELQDPDGQWREGDAAPGDRDAVTNPGDANDIPVSVDEETGLPLTWTLYDNFPNPFNPVTNIRYSLPESADLQIEVFDALGNEVTTIASGVHQAGTHLASWNGRYSDGTYAPSGVYIYRISAGSFVQAKTMLLLK